MRLSLSPASLRCPNHSALAAGASCHWIYKLRKIAHKIALSAGRLEYLTASWQGVARQESLDPLSQGAQDIWAYDCIKDVSRVERFVYDRPVANGCSPMTRTTGLHARTAGSQTPTVSHPWGATISIFGPEVLGTAHGCWHTKEPRESGRVDGRLHQPLARLPDSSGPT
jgi:hypothetical protein